jgi:hypothetical protein
MVVSIMENWNGMPASSPNRNIWTPQKDNGQRFGQPTSPICHGSANSQINKGHRNYVRGKVNHVTAEQAQDTPDFVLDTFPVKLCACNDFI